MSNQSLIYSLYQIGAIQFGEFKLKSGQITSVYMNLRKVVSYPTILRNISQLMWQSIKDCQFDLICGVPYTALPIATCLSLDHDIPMIMRRKEKKDYGTKQMIEGEFHQGQRCLIVEDVITTGASIFETVDELEKLDIIAKDVVVLVDREQNGKQTLETKFNVYTIFTLSSILHTLLASDIINTNERVIIETFLQMRKIAC